MAATAQVVPEAPLEPVRRFELPDLSRHGAWIMPRLLQAYPHLNERAAANWLQTIIHNNEYMFLFQEHGVALAQVLSSHTLSGKPLIQERFVWVEDRKEREQVRNAAAFYDQFLRWAKGHGAEVIIVEEMTDVPHEMIKERLGRVFSREQKFARV